MSEEIRNDTRRKVASVGNSWIVCKSKSHPGHVYYFNSLTGETAWNLSDAEIEKAKCRTKHLEHLPGTKPNKCPEPKDKPPSTELYNSEPPQSLSSGQLVINEISEQSSVLTYSNVANSNVTFCAPFNQISGVPQDTHINNPSSIEPVCNFDSFNQSLSTYHLNTTPTVYNPNVWAVPHTQQVFIAPVVKHNPGPLNVAYNNFSQTVSQPATGLVFNSFANANPSAIITSGTRTFNSRGFNHDQGVKRTINKKNGFTNKNDLRQKLSSKKRYNMKSSIPGGSGFLKANPRKADTTAHIANKFEGIHSNDLSTGLESRCVETQLHEIPSKIDLGPLKSLAPSDSNADAWFIVVDLEVLLHEFKFLTTLTDSDEKCHLMVPKRVMDELKSYVTCTENIQAKRILRFLSQQIEIGYAYMAEEPSKVEGDSMAEVIYTTCTELLSNHYHLILLTNDNELLSKGLSIINMFCVDDIKFFLMGNTNKQLVSSGSKKPFMSDELINKIKITVPNDVPQIIDTTSPVRDIETDDHTDNIPITPTKQNITPDKTEESIIFKHTVDAGIQTDLEDINASISMTNVVEKQGLNADSIIFPQNTKEAITRRSVSLVLNIPDKKREIKLKRSTSHQPPVNSSESERKQFKWGRRRNTSQVNDQIPSLDQDMKTKNVESLQPNTLHNEKSKFPNSALNNNPTLGRIENKISDDSIESRESSIYAEPRSSTTKENVTIEETSTSIISNTESNVDADSTYSNSTNSINQQSNYNGQSNKPMYEVDSITMEQYLRMKCDEWISRFIQIMEEVLSQVLQQDPPFTHNAMPPPWTLHEAAQCVSIKFCSHQSITAAANKLSNVLFQVSDAKGKITMNMTPYQYMQMYSYGVHLLAAIMEVTTSCEDIQIAVESLNKLLHDIRNPTMESSTNDTFNDIKPDNDVSVQSDLDLFKLPDVADNTDDSSLHGQEMLPDWNHMEGVHKDIPKKIKSKEELQKPVKFIRNFDVPFPFLKSLSLQGSNSVNTVKSPVKPRDEQNLTHSQIGEGINPHNANEITKKETDSDVPTNQPNIIRTFTKCLQLEEKLKIKYNSKDYENDDLDCDESYVEYITENDCSEDDNYNEQRHNAYGNQTDEEADTNEDYKPKSLKDDNSLLSDETSKKFKYMMYMLLQEIRNALSQVRILCDQCYKELKNPDQSTELKCQLRKMAERAHLHTIRLCRSLESMLDHETNNPTQSISDLLEQSGINIRHVDARLLFEYRTSVENCKNHADQFLSLVQNIISDTKR